MGSVWARGAFAVAWLFIASAVAHAQEPVAQADGAAYGGGLALGGTLGAHAPVIGPELAYYVEVTDSLYLTPYLGLGVFKGTINPAGGLMLVFGARHRFLVDVGYGAIAWSTAARIEDGELVRGEVTRTYHGVSILAGYEFVATTGFLVRPSLGLATYVGDTPAIGDPITPSINLTLGYKLW